jgi:hypothetical protein
MAKQMKDGLQTWMDKHLVVMTLSDDKKQEKKIKKAIHNKVRESLTAENKNVCKRKLFVVNVPCVVNCLLQSFRNK